MGQESRIELWSPNGRPFCFAGFGTDRLRRPEAMKTAGRENPIHGVAWPCNRARGVARQNRSCSIKWAAKQENLPVVGSSSAIVRAFQKNGLCQQVTPA